MSEQLDVHLDEAPRPIPPLEGDLIHHRMYDVQVVRETTERMRLRGTVTDRKPPGLYFDGDDRSLVVHHMVVDLVVAFPTMEILDAIVHLETHPHSICRKIEDHYEQLVGLSIARGFTHKVRDLFGGPRGCTHTTALLLAMAPAAIQAAWSMVPPGERPDLPDPELPMSQEEIRQRFAFSLNTCHVWDETGDFVQETATTGEVEIPLWAIKRSKELGRAAEEWINR